MDKVAVSQIAEKNYSVQIQPVRINKISYATGFFFEFIYGVLQGDFFLAGYF